MKRAKVGLIEERGVFCLRERNDEERQRDRPKILHKRKLDNSKTQRANQCTEHRVQRNPNLADEGKTSHGKTDKRFSDNRSSAGNRS